MKKRIVTSHAWMIALCLGTGVLTVNASPSQQSRIAFASNRDGNFEIYIMNPDGTGQVNLSRNPAQDRDPGWLPDGRIAFSSDRDGKPCRYVMNADGAHVEKLADVILAWSPDGQTVAYSQDSVLFVRCADGSNLQRVGEGCAPSWAPDGKRLVFSAGQIPRIAVFDVVHGKTEMIDVPTKKDGDVGWGMLSLSPIRSPSGDRILFTTAAVKKGVCGMNYELCTLSVDTQSEPPVYGREVLRLTSTPESELGCGWSPDGSEIIYHTHAHSRASEDAEIYIMKPDGTDRHRLTHNEAVDQFPAWSSVPDEGVPVAQQKEGK